MSWYKKAQNEEDTYETEPYLRELVKNISKDLFGPKVEQLKTSFCSTTYSVGGTRVGLFVTMGNNVALAFSGDRHYRQFPLNDEKWLNSNWVEAMGNNVIKGHYRHQNPDNPVGPTYDLLPEGEDTLIDFVERYKGETDNT